MMTRMMTASAAVLVAALAAAPTAQARPQQVSYRSDGEYTWPGDQFARSRRANDDDESERAGRRMHRHHAARHEYARYSRDDDDTEPAERSEQRVRRHSHHEGGGASTSRGCLRPAARALLERIEAHFGRVQIVSTCRPGAVIAGSGRPSKHASGQAIDFNAPRGRKAELVRWLIANHRNGGTMTYAHMGHVHVDVGYHFVALNSRNGG
jgi:uncharacterized protein YcbK (DUF882 family)